MCPVVSMDLVPDGSLMKIKTLGLGILKGRH